LRSIARKFAWLSALLVAWIGVVLVIRVLTAPRARGAIVSKIHGGASGCPWRNVLTFQSVDDRFAVLDAEYKKKLQATDFDPRFGIERVQAPDRAFWLKRKGQHLGGKDLLAYLLAEHQWMGENNPEHMVQKGAIVLDCGAHVGVFTHNALRRGAGKVIAIEPDPTNIECLRRNFTAEIQTGRVVIVPKGVWSSSGSMKLYEGIPNSGMNSMVLNTEGKYTEVPVITIDNLSVDLDLPRIDYIKMDIEGAEREALKGARSVLARYKPQLALDSYHRPDDPAVLPPIILSANSKYHVYCGPCEMKDEKTLVPHVMYYQ
jgi:FkbM family methyltransferase